jgi:hypothetical protein
MNTNDFNDLQRRKNLSNMNLQGHELELEKYNKQVERYNNPISIQDVISCDPNIYIVVAPAIDIFYNREKGNPILKAENDYKKEVGAAMYNRALPVVAVGSNVKEFTGMKPLHYVIIKKGQPALHHFYFDNIGYLAFENHSMLLYTSLEDSTRITNDYVRVEESEVN